MRSAPARLLAALALFVTLSGTATALTVLPTAYAMPNGMSGAYNYWDDSYSGFGNNQVNGAALWGGTGDLTDGLAATQNWNFLEHPIGPNGPYVGWRSINPEIVFTFAKTYIFDTITFYFDDSDYYGGVLPPTGVSVNGAYHPTPPTPGSHPFVWSISMNGTVGQEVKVQIFRDAAWVFLSEVTFSATLPQAVPIPGSVFGLALGLAGLGLFARRRQRRHRSH